MRLMWHPSASEDYLHWQRTDRATLRKVNDLLKDIRRSPFDRNGKPEPLRGDLAGWWSRRITAEHRLVYRVREHEGGETVEIVQCRYHY